MKTPKQNVSERILSIIEEIQHKTIADIGTDHGYIPIYACMWGSVSKAVACDIRPGPLAVAKKNIAAYNLIDKVQTRLGNGLSSVSPKEVECVIIAGMGGDSIINILSGGKDVVANLKQLVLSPQSNVAKVRYFLHSAGWKITNEKIVCETDKFYNIITSVQGSEPVYTKGEYAVGKILLQKMEPHFLNYARTQVECYERIKAKATGQRLAEIEGLLNIYKEIGKIGEIL